MRRRKVWGWGFEGDTPDPRALAFAESSLTALFGGPAVRRSPPAAGDLRLPSPARVDLPGLEHLIRRDPEERALHALGRSFRDLARSTRGRFDHPPDAVAYPESAADVVRLLDAASRAHVAVVPFGGGTSVAGGVECARAEHAGVLTIDLSRMDALVDVDTKSLAAHVQAGATGPALEAALKPHGLSCRFYPQSFELSTVGGWVATRAGGHFATGPTHIDDLVEAVTMIAPTGVLSTRRLPGSGAGPAPERLVLGSEGSLGVVTDAWLRVFERPTARAAATVAFEDTGAGAEAVRAIVQAGYLPTNLRLLDGAEALMSGAGAPDRALLLIAYESAAEPPDAWLRATLDMALSRGGVLVGDVRSSRDGGGGRDATAETYKAAFFRAPYLRDEIVLRGAFVETYETAVTWDRLAELDAGVREAIGTLSLGPHLVARRITHVYRDGCAPYYTVICRAPEDGGLGMWDDLKAAITDAIIRGGGTCTHHHAVGRDVVPWYRAERADLFHAALRGAKSELDPRGVMNPGVLGLGAPARSAP